MPPVCNHLPPNSATISARLTPRPIREICVPAPPHHLRPHSRSHWQCAARRGCGEGRARLFQTEEPVHPTLCIISILGAKINEYEEKGWGVGLLC